MRRHVLTFTIAAALFAQSCEAADAERCLTETQASNLFLAIAPTVIKQVGAGCAQYLPQNALLRRPDDPLFAAYAREAETATPGFQEALATLTGDPTVLKQDSKTLRDAFATAMQKQFAGGLTAETCGIVDHLLGLMAPLPPRNLVDILTTIIRLSGDDRKKGKKSDIPICPTKLAS